MIDWERFNALSFDCYGTLIDWETGIADALGIWAEAAHLRLSPDELIAAHARHETAVQTENPAMLYPEVLAETLRRIGRDSGVSVRGEDALRYGSSVGDWPAFADSAASLAALKPRFRLIIVSNVDRASFALSNRRLKVEFDLIVTAEDIGSYKPDLANFRYMFDQAAAIGITRDSILHVAESLYHDHEPAQRLEMPSAWIHRRHSKGGFGAAAEPSGEVAPRWRFDSLAEFASAAVG